MTDGNHYARWVPCNRCGSMVLTTAPRTTCDECRKEREHERAKRRWDHYKCKIEPDAYIVEYDPLKFENGGFRKGAIINREQLRCMLTISASPFMIGMRLKNKSGNLFEIVCKKMGAHHKKNGGLKLIAV